MIDALVVHRRDEAEGICSLELAAADGSALPPFEPGAHIDVQPQPGLIRQYSLCPAPAGLYRLGVLREPASRGGSAAMHRLQVGQRLPIGTPRQQFALQPGAKRTLLLAGGIGITPLWAMAEHLAASGAGFALHYCGRSAARMAFVPALRRAPVGLDLHLHLDDGGPAQRLDLDAALGAPQAGTHVYVCGPAGFMAWVLDGARARGWPEAQLHREYFAAPVAPAGTVAAGFEVQLGHGGPVLAVPAGRSVIEVLAAHGTALPVSCEQGVCGTCLTRVLSGQPEHHDVYLTDAEKAANDCFTPCCSRAVAGSRLVLDV